MVIMMRVKVLVVLVPMKYVRMVMMIGLIEPENQCEKDTNRRHQDQKRDQYSPILSFSSIINLLRCVDIFYNHCVLYHIFFSCLLQFLLISLWHCVADVLSSNLPRIWSQCVSNSNLFVIFLIWWSGPILLRYSDNICFLFMTRFCFLFCPSWKSLIFGENKIRIVRMSCLWYFCPDSSHKLLTFCPQITHITHSSEDIHIMTSIPLKKCISSVLFREVSHIEQAFFHMSTCPERTHTPHITRHNWRIHSHNTRDKIVLQ